MQATGKVFHFFFDLISNSSYIQNVKNIAFRSWLSKQTNQEGTLEFDLLSGCYPQHFADQEEIKMKTTKETECGLDTGLCLEMNPGHRYWTKFVTTRFTSIL